MDNTYSWMINALDSYPEQDGNQDVVFTVHWTRLATDGEHTVSIYGTQGVTLDPEAHFTPYPDLTFEQVCGWLESAMGAEQVASMDAGLDQQIENQINPPVVTLPLPWAQAAE